MVLETIKDKSICDEICSIFFEQFSSCYKITPGELLLNRDYLIFYVKDSKSIVYCAINTIQHLHLGHVAINFSYSYTRETLRGLGLGDKYFKERLSYLKNNVVESTFTATIRVNNIPSLKIMFNNNFTPIANFKYKDGGDGLKFIKL